MKTNNTLRIVLSVILIALVIALVFFIARLISMSQTPVSDVRADLSPREVIVSNLTASSAVVSWYSEESVEAFLEYGSEAGQFSTKLLDFRDTTAPSARKLFYVKLTNLLPERKYYFQITAGTEKFSSPESTYSLTTLLSTDNLGVPDPILISAPDDFVEGIAYIHSSVGDSISTTASVFSTTPNITIDKSTMKDRSTGEPFDFTGGLVKVAITSSSGERASTVIQADDPSLTISTISLTNGVYVANTLVTAEEEPTSFPVSSPTSDEGDSASNPIVLATCNSTCASGKYCLCPSNCNNPAAVYLATSNPLVCGGDKASVPPTGGNPTPTPNPVPVPVPTPTPVPVPTPTPAPTLPSTDVNSDIATALTVGFGILMIVLGYQLRRNRNLD